MPSSLKGALVRETARRGISLNEVATSLLADALGVPYTPSGRKSPLPGASPVVLLRVPSDLKHELEAEAGRDETSVNDVVVRTLADALAVPTPQPREEPMASSNGSRNGRSRSDDKVRVALIGVGNCANSLVQGVEFYKDADPDAFVPGLMHVDLGGYHVRDI